MEKYDKITVIGTSHIAIQSVREVESVILKEKPDIVALELDQRRFLSMMAKKRRLQLRDVRQFGIRGFLWNLVGAWAERKLGKLVGMSPGAEMRKAIQSAHKIKADIALIDQDITVTLKKLTKRITWREKWHFLVDLVKPLFIRGERIKMDLRKVPDKQLIKKITAKVKERYPSIYTTLISERNVVLAKSLYKLKHQYAQKTIVVVMGAGHTEGVLKILRGLDRKK